MMLNKTVGLFLVMAVLGSTLISCNQGQKPATDDEFCHAVFEALQNNDVELFTSLLVTEEQLQSMINSLDDADPKEKSIKDEFISDFTVEKMADGSLKSFNKLVRLGQEKSMHLENAVYSGIHFRQTRYEAGNHKCKKLKFKMTVGEEFYSVIVYLFQTDDEMFAYDELQVNEMPNYKFNLVSPAENPVTVTAGQDLDLVIEFNADAANERGAWIQTVFNGKGGGMYYDSSMESPYKTDIPAKVLTPGKHTVEYFLQPSGSNTDNPLAEIKLDIVVK